MHSSTGWRIRIYSDLPLGGGPGESRLRSSWPDVDARTVVLAVDPSCEHWAWQQ